MTRGIALVSLIGLAGLAAAGGATLVQHARNERYYRDLLASGESALSGGNTFAALEAFSGAVALRPDAMPAYYRRAEAYRLQQQYEKAAADLRLAMRLAPEAPQPRIALGDLEDELGDPADAARWYQSAADRLKDADPALLYRLALAFYRAGSPAAAVAPLRLALGRNDSFAEAHYLLGLAYRDIQRDADAIASLEQAIRIAPSLTAAREELADLYRAADRPADELTQLEALAARDDQANRRVAVALGEARHGQFAQALEALAREGARSPGDSRVDLALGRVYLMLAERSRDRVAIRQALLYLEKALGGTVRRSQGLAFFGRALHLSGDAVQAERILQEAIATSPVYLPAFEYVAAVAEQLGHAAAARDALIRLDALQGSTTTAVVRARRAQRIGRLSLTAGDAQLAAEYLQLAVLGGLDDPDTWGPLARARLATGDLSGASDALAHALATRPRDPDLLRLARAIKATAGRADPAARPPRN